MTCCHAHANTTFPIPARMHNIYVEHTQTNWHTHSQIHKQLYGIDRVNVTFTIYTCTYTSVCTNKSIYTNINIPAPGLPCVCFVMFSRVFMMTFMFISWYLQDLWSNHHLFWSQNVVNSIVFYFFIIFHWYLHAFVNARSRKRLFQDALFFDGFAFRHRKTTKKLDFSLFFWRSSFTACSLEESRLSNGSDWHRHCFPSAIAIVWRTATTVGSVLRLCELQCC